MELLRIKRPEMLKEQSPEDLGRVLGLDRAPEVKTVRRKLSRLATVGRATEFGRALANDAWPNAEPRWASCTQMGLFQQHATGCGRRPPPPGAVHA